MSDSGSIETSEADARPYSQGQAMPAPSVEQIPLAAELQKLAAVADTDGDDWTPALDLCAPEAPSPVGLRRSHSQESAWRVGWMRGWMAGRAEQQAPSVEPHPLTLLQAGLTNAELLAQWRKKLPGVEPTDSELSAFAVGAEVGWQRATAEAAQPAALLVRDLAASLGVEPLAVCRALADMGHGEHSVNMAVPATAVGAVERHLAAQQEEVEPALTRADLYDDIVSRLRFEPLTRAQQHAQIGRAVVAWREQCATVAQAAQPAVVQPCKGMACGAPQAPTGKPATDSKHQR